MTFQNGATGQLPGSLWLAGGIANGVGGSATVTLQSGGKLNAGGFVILAADPTDTASLTVTGANSALTAGTSLLVGGNGTVTGGTSSASILNGGSANIASTIVVYANSTLTVGSGTTPAALQGGGGGLLVDGTVNFNSGTLITAGTLDVGGTVFLSSRGASNKKVLDVGSATLTASGVVDLNDNDMIIRSNQKTYVTQQIRQARNGGLWNQAGITSTAAKNNPAHNTTLGVLLGSEYSGANGGTTTFNGRTVAATDTLVKYTYYGDTDFNGKVNFDDYVRTDNGFNNHLSGWLNGDFDGNGAVNFDDYVLIDLAFNTQTGTLGRVIDGLRAGPGADRTIVNALSGGLASVGGATEAVAEQVVYEHLAQMGEEYRNSFLTRAVPEPVTGLSLLGITATCVLSRRTRRRF